MAEYKALIKDKKTQNWLKASIAINITKDGLSDFINNVAGQIQQTILTDVRKNLSVSATCNTCRTGNAVQCPSTRKCPNTCTLHKDTSVTYKVCPNQICHNFAPELSKYHRFHKPSWKNTEATKWCTSAWEIAKCYHPPDGYLDKADASVTDFNGVVSVIINCKEFDNHVTENLADKKNIFVQSHDVVKRIRHTATLQVEGTDLKDAFTAMKAILSDTKTLSGNIQAQEAMKTLSLLEADTLTITTDDVVKLIQDALDDTQTVISEAGRVSEEAKHTNEETKELQSKLDVLNNKEEELKKLLQVITEAREKAIKDIELTGQHVTNAATEKIKIAGEMEKSRMQETGQLVKQDIDLTGEHVTNATTEKIKIAAQLEESHVKKTGQMVKLDVEHTGEHVTKAAIRKIKIAAEMEETRVNTYIEMVKQDLRTQETKTLDARYNQRKLDLQQTLAHYYWTEYDSMPLSPLIPEIDDKLSKVYMALKMNKVNTNSSKRSVETPDSVDTYKSLFYDHGNNPHRNIYLQGEAGIGKTTFCNKLGLVWSEKYHPECSKKDNSINQSTVKQEQRQVFSDESIIQGFDFVFSLALRNVEGECQIENMIETQIISGLPDHTKYAGLVPEILDKERCLIIMDGLDEWSHRSDLCKKSQHVPHRKSWSATTVLTSTRPWKMNEVRLKDSEISTLIQITGITDAEAFTETVLNCLNDKYKTHLDARDFLTYIKDKKLEHIIDIPVIAMQLLWLWHSGHELGDSKCQIYINMLDMLFGRAEEKSPSACDDIAEFLTAGLPPCFESTKFCDQHKMLLDYLSNLAFHTLHSCKREGTLVFSDSVVAKYVKSPVALKTALETGILSQYKSPSRTVRCSLFSFLHKTFQEFLAAYYIATHAHESENIVQTLFQVYGQTVDIMDISELFIFVCGLNTELSSKISNSVMKSFSAKLTNHVEELHVSGSGYNVGVMTESLQKMILAGYKESISNGHQNPQLALHHVYYDRYISCADKVHWNILVDRNIDTIVTLCAQGTYTEKYAGDVVKIQQILTQSSSTLSHVRLQSVNGLKDLDMFTNITLKSLNLFDINTRFDMKLSTSSLLYCCLWSINKEVEHNVLFALTATSQLHTLDVRLCKNVSVLCQVLPTLPMLHTLHLYEDKIPVSLCQVLSTLSQLQRLTVAEPRSEVPSPLCRAMSTLSNLQFMELCYTDLGDNAILLPNSIQEIVLDGVKLTCRSVRQLVDSLTQIQHQVTCRLWRCTVRTLMEWDAIVKHIQQSDMFDIQKNIIHSSGYISLYFTKIQ